MSEPLYFQFPETVSRTFYLNGKRYTVKHKSLPAGTYELRATLSHSSPTKGGEANPIGGSSNG